MKKIDSVLEVFALIFAVVILFCGAILITHGFHRPEQGTSAIAGAILIYTGCKIVKTVFYSKEER